MFELYNDEARRTIFSAQGEACGSESMYIESEHLLLGLLKEDSALLSRFLFSEVPLESFRNQLHREIPALKSAPGISDPQFSNECKRALAYAAEESVRMGDRHIGTEHLVLGLLREEHCFAAEMLRKHGANLNKVRKSLKGEPEGLELEDSVDLFGKIGRFLKRIGKD